MIPADHQITAEAIGKAKLLKMLSKAALAYRRTMWYLLRYRGLGALVAFLGTKTIVPTGEGSGELAYYLIGPILRRFPSLCPYPRWVEIEVTTRCDKRCIICEHTYWKEPSRDLTFEDFRHIVDMFPELTWVNLTGEGDAFLNRDYLKMIRYLKERNVAVYLVDSFNLIDRNRAYELVHLGVDGIYISMDGASKETYERIKVGCNFERTLQNIGHVLEAKRALASPIPEICFRFAITKWNLYEMPDFVRLIRHLAPKDDWGDMAKIHFVGLLTFPEIESLHVSKLPRGLVAETLETSEGDPESLPVILAHTEPEKFPNITSCLAWMEPYIMMGGYVLPCCAVLMSNRRPWLRNHAFGNAFDQSFRQIWSSPRYTRFRRMVNRPDAPVPALCQGCRSYNTLERERLHGVDASL